MKKLSLALVALFVVTSVRAEKELSFFEQAKAAAIEAQKALVGYLSNAKTFVTDSTPVKFVAGSYEAYVAPYVNHDLLTVASLAAGTYAVVKGSEKIENESYRRAFVFITAPTVFFTIAVLANRLTKAA